MVFHLFRVYNYNPGYIKKDFFAALKKEIPWSQGTVEVYGKEYLIPRLQCFMGDEGIKYRYSGRMLHAKEWANTVRILKEMLLKDYGLDFNNVLCNYYRDGKDKVGWHFDNEPELDDYPIASLSFGAARFFDLKHFKTNEKIRFNLGPGDLFIMDQECLKDYQHQVPQQLKISEPRINLTFRKIKVDLFR